MQNKNDFSERELVETLLSAELTKPYQEMDADFVKECSDFLVRLDGYQPSLSERDVAERVKKISSSWISRRKRLVRRLSLISACLAAAIVAVNLITWN